VIPRKARVASLVLGLLALPAGAATIFVSKTGTDDPGCGQPVANACQTIQYAYDNEAAAGDTIRVMPGTYNECVFAWGFDLLIDKPVRLVAEEWEPTLPATTGPPDNTVTVIDGTGVCDGIGVAPGATVSIGGTGAELTGFTIRGGGASGVFAQGSVAITHNVITGNSSPVGAGIYLYTAACYYGGDVDATIANNTVTANHADAQPGVDFLGDGGGIFVWAAGFQAGGFCLGGNAAVTVQDNLVENNTIHNASSGQTAEGAGIGVLIDPRVVPPPDPPLPADPGAATVVVTRNTIRGNTTQPGSVSYGGGVWAGTYYPGQWAVEITDNTIENNQATANGGGLSIFQQIDANPALDSKHSVLIDGNAIQGNAAGSDGGGMDLFSVVTSLGAGDSQSLVASSNLVTGNQSALSGGGIFAEYTSLKSVDAARASLFVPPAPFPADAMGFSIEGNVVTDNTAFAGAGVTLLLTADADPTSNPPFCDVTAPAVSAVDFTANLVTGNVTDADDVLDFGLPGCSDPLCEAIICAADSYCCDVLWDEFCADATIGEPTCEAGCAAGSNCCVSKSANAPGVLVQTLAVGEARSIVSIGESTVAANVIVDEGFVGGIETTSVADIDCQQLHEGTSTVTIDRSVVYGNDLAGIGGPLHAPDDHLTLAVTKTSSFGNTGLDYEDTLFPGGTPPDNIVDDPLIDPGTLRPDVCSVVFDVGECSIGGATCVADADCGAGTCVAEGAGFFRSPDVNTDDLVDGIDVLDVSVAWTAKQNRPPQAPDPRYDARTDLDRDGEVDGDDLALIAAEFGAVCPQN
jgi:predicted outer membrane repeat protein